MLLCCQGFPWLVKDLNIGFFAVVACRQLLFVPRFKNGTSPSGQAGIVGTKPYAVETPSKNSFENWINESCSYAFTDFKKFNILNSFRQTEFKMNGSVVEVLHKKYTAAWTSIFDGVFYIKNMYPCKLER